MKKLLLILTSILFLQFSYSFAESLPALPSPELPNIEEATVPEEKKTGGISDPQPKQKSWFDRVKSMFGFGKADKADDNTNNNNKEIGTSDDEDNAEADNNESSGGEVQGDSSKNEQGEDESIEDIVSDLQLPEGFNDWADNKEVNEEIKQEEPETSAISDDNNNDLVESKTDKSVEPQEKVADVSDDLKETIPDSDNQNEVETVQELPLQKEEQDEAQDQEKAEGLLESEQSVPKSPIANYLKHQARADKMKDISLIPEEELKVVDDVQEEEKNKLDPAQEKFASDEAKVLLLPSDDIVLGKMADQAKLDLMDFRSYVKIFWKNYKYVKEESKREKIKAFIDNYDENFNQEKFTRSKQENCKALELAAKYIDKNNINKLRVMLDQYQVLQLRGSKGSSLLHKAAYTGNYNAAKLLILKGTNIKAKNDWGMSPLCIAKKYDRGHIAFLLESSGANSK